MEVMDAAVSIRVEDHGDRRHVTITGPHYVMGQLRERSEFDSRYSGDLLERLAQLKSGHLWDEILRLDRPQYIEGPLSSMFADFGVDLSGRMVLDCGSGAGASSILLLRQGAAHVCGVEVVAECVEVARLRAAEEGYAGQVDFLCLEDAPHVPREDGSVDIVLANALLEHIPPEARPSHLREWWRLLRPGGFLLLRETPNRLWPKDGHTSGLWWVPYMPLWLARRYAAARSPRVSAADSAEDLLVAGIRGATYWEIIRPLPGEELIEWNRRLGGDVERYFRFSLTQPGEGRGKRFAKRLLQGSLGTLERFVLRPLGIPACALLPYLTVCLQKQGEPDEGKKDI
jgi:SAM-dependent methyltransferase